MVDITIKVCYSGFGDKIHLVKNCWFFLHTPHNLHSLVQLIRYNSWQQFG